MEVHHNLRPWPTREQVEAKLQDLIEGQCSREEAARWAAYWITLDEPDDFPLEVSEALDALAGADMKMIDGEYVHDTANMRSWLKDLQDS